MVSKIVIVSTHHGTIAGKTRHPITDSKVAPSSSSRDPRRNPTKSLDPRHRSTSNAKQTPNESDSARSGDGKRIGEASTTPPLSPLSQPDRVGLPAHLLALLGAQDQPTGSTGKSPSNGSNRDASASAFTSTSRVEHADPSKSSASATNEASSIPGVPKDFMASLANLLEGAKPQQPL